MFAAGLAFGVGIGLALGLAFGQYLMSQGLNTLQDTIAKVAYSIRHPTPPTPPVQTPPLATESGFDTQEMDEERIPDWMEDDYPLPMRGE